MHEHGLTDAAQGGLAIYYFIVGLFNVGFGIHYIQARQRILALLWLAVVGVFFLHAALYVLHKGPEIPHAVTHAIDVYTNPVSYFVVATVAFAALLIFRKVLTEPNVALGLTNLALLASGWAMTEPNFRGNLTTPDNVPIIILIATVGFTTWLALRRAVINDDRIARGEPPMEKDDDKVLVWPDLVYTELICMVIATAALVFWGIFLQAPLEQPATAAKAPNPSKAPWYFLGLQEMLVYFDPWMAGVVLPTMILTGLIAMPYIDYNTKGNGYYTFKERPFALTMFLFGFLVLWVVLIILGTILRGPNWNFFGPFAYWDPHISNPANNANLSELFWLPFGYKAKSAQDMPNYLMRELPGLIVLGAYFLVLPPLLAKTVMRTMFLKMGFLRYYVLIIHLLFMMLLPIKMVLRWTLTLKYIVYMPEFSFNI